MRDEAFYNRVGGERISDRQIDELIGLAQGLCADGIINQKEVEFLQKWTAANAGITDQPFIASLFTRIQEILADNVADPEECEDLFETLKEFSSSDAELGEAIKPATFPLCDPAPILVFEGRRYCLTGTFVFGKRAECKRAAEKRGAVCGSLTRATDVVVVGQYATESWKHSGYGTKIEKAMRMREEGLPISIVSEQHWTTFL